MRSQFLAQLVVGTGLMMCGISDGYIFGQMSGMIDAFQTTDTSINFTQEDISWMASTINILCVVGFIIFGNISAALGRRITVIILNSLAIVSWILLYFASDKTTLICSRIILGICYGGFVMIVLMCIAEYHPPKMRPLCMTLVTGLGLIIGTMLGHLLSLVFHWRTVALMGVIPSSVSGLLSMIWEESPAWLASKGKFEECEKAFRALHPRNVESENELQLLLVYEKTKQRGLKRKFNNAFVPKKLIFALKQAYFWKIILISNAVCIYKVANCRVLFNTIAITMLHRITGSSDILVFTLFVHGFTAIGTMISLLLFNKFKIRKILFTTGIAANVVLVLFSLSIYLWEDNGYYLSWLRVTLLSLYFIITTAGPSPVIDTITTEVMPVDLKSSMFIIIGIVAGTFQFLSIMFATAMTSKIGYHGIFFFNSAVIFVCLIYLWFYMPETKGRSLHEIEYFFKHNNFNYNNELFCKNQTDVLCNKNENE